MDLVTVACQRDIQDLLLQAHTIDKFIDRPCRHWITVEDESLTPEEWHGLLAPYYTRHKLFLTFSKRPDLEFDAPFTIGYRRQQTLKLITAANVLSDVCLVLDCKNFFIKETSLESWPYTNGNGRYTILEQEPEYFLPRAWVEYIHTNTNIEKPKVFPSRLATPFACTREYARNAIEHPMFEKLFFQTEVIPMTEMFYYYFFVPHEKIELSGTHVGGALSAYDNPDDIDYHIKCATGFTHGLHRKARSVMSMKSKQIYKQWLISLDLNPELVNNYVNFKMTDTSWGF